MAGEQLQGTCWLSGGGAAWLLFGAQQLAAALALV